MNLDNANLAATLDPAIHRLTDVAAAAIDLANMFALIGAVFFVATLLMRTIVPLRIAALISNVFFIGYGVLSNSINAIFVYCLLLPINSVRLYQMIRLIRKARVSAQGDLSMNWLKPFMIRRTYRKGDVLFRKGGTANEMFFTVTRKTFGDRTRHRDSSRTSGG